MALTMGDLVLRAQPSDLGRRSRGVPSIPTPRSVSGGADAELLRRRWACRDDVHPSEEVALGHDAHQLATVDDG